MAGVGSRFDFHLTKTLCDLRTRELFDIIIDFPESTPALEDLKVHSNYSSSQSSLIVIQECLSRVDQRANLVQSLRKVYVPQSFDTNTS